MPRGQSRRSQAHSGEVASEVGHDLLDSGALALLEG